jgi:hypothetical protein
MWQVEQGNLLEANDDLEKVCLICGTTCEPYKIGNGAGSSRKTQRLAAQCSHLGQ